MHLAAGVAGALLCALFTNLGLLLKHRGANDCVPLCLRDPWRCLSTLVASRVFMLGWAVGGAGFACHVVAIASDAPLPLVKAILAGGLVVLAVLCDVIGRQRLGARQWTGVALMAVGLAVIGVQMPMTSQDMSPSSEQVVGFQVGLLACGGLVLLLWRSRRALGLGVMAGTLWGCGDLTIKFLSLGPEHPFAYLPVLLLIGGLAFVVSARAYQGTEAVAVITFSSLAANLGGMAGGLALFTPLVADGAATMVSIGVALTLVLLSGALIPSPRTSPLR